MKQLLSIVFTVVLFLSCFPQKSKAPPKPPLSQAKLSAIEEDIKGWAEGRWLNYTVGYDQDDETVIIQIAVDPSANEIAINSYVKILKDVFNKHASGYKLVGRIYQYGELINTVFD